MILRVILRRYLKISKENMIKKDRICVPLCPALCNPTHGAVSVSLSPRRLNIYQGRLIYFLLINTIILSLAPPRPG